ncbi:MAG: VCBS repeat-containing protein [Phycisphaerae bacterium]|nr:VCBS repeat-containing protein [Phycisphaerae bacterium]
MRRFLLTGLLALLPSAVATAADALVVLHPTPYATLGDSGLFGAMSLDDEFKCETFEDGSVNTLGLTIVGGTIVAPAATTDSVDADDGSVNGSGTGGRSYRANAGSSVALSFSSAALGGYPERVGVVFTDGPSAATLVVTVETGFGPTFTKSVGPVGDAADNGATAEDRLVSITSSFGIKKVTLSLAAPNAGASFEIDHVQYEDPVVKAASQWNQHDFDDDGSSDDILWFNASGSAGSWLMNGYSIDSSGVMTPTVPATWTFVGAGATDNSKKTFAFWRDTATGLFYVWKISGNEAELEGALENVGPVSADWVVLAVKDVDGDLDADLVFQNSTTGSVVAWILDNHSVVNSVTLGSAAGLTFVGAGDFNGDFRDDLLWRTSSGVVKGWLLTSDDSAPFGGAIVWDDKVISGASPISSAWTVHAIGDLDGDGCDDLIWRNSSNGNVNVWRLVGLAKAAGGAIAQNVSPQWKIEGLVDLNGDGSDDILWHHSSNHQINGWCMDGLTKLSGSSMGTTSAGWKICNY